MCWEIHQIGAIDVQSDLHIQCQVLVLPNDGHHHIYYPDELESYTFC